MTPTTTKWTTSNSNSFGATSSPLYVIGHLVLFVLSLFSCARCCWRRKFQLAASLSLPLRCARRLVSFALHCTLRHCGHVLTLIAALCGGAVRGKACFFDARLFLFRFADVVQQATNYHDPKDEKVYRVKIPVRTRRAAVVGDFFAFFCFCRRPGHTTTCDPSGSAKAWCFSIRTIRPFTNKRCLRRDVGIFVAFLFFSASCLLIRFSSCLGADQEDQSRHRRNGLRQETLDRRRSAPKCPRSVEWSRVLLLTRSSSPGVAQQI